MCALRWALDWNPGGRSQVYLLPVNRLLAGRASARTLRPRPRRRSLGAPGLTEVSFSAFLKAEQNR